MSLSQLANAANADADATRRREVAKRRAIIANNCEDRVRELVGSLEVPIVALDVVVEEVVTVYHKGAYNEYRSHERYSVHRFRVDDIVLRLNDGTRSHTGGGPYSPEIGYVAVERACDCGRVFGVPIDYYVYVGKNDTPDTQAAKFIKQVGTALRKGAKCSFCAADVPRCCPMCGRGN